MAVRSNKTFNMGKEASLEKCKGKPIFSSGHNGSRLSVCSTVPLVQMGITTMLDRSKIYSVDIIINSEFMYVLLMISQGSSEF